MMETYSHSKLSTFEQCTLRYKYQYIDKIKTDISTTIEAFMGDIVHRTLEKLYKDKQFMKENTKEELLEFYDKLWAEEYNDSILIVKEEYTAENYRLKGRKMIEEYYDEYKPFNEGKIIGLETEDFYELNDEYKVHVRIDRLMYMGDGVYEIHDYKTNSNLKTQPEADIDRQLAIYNLGVKKLYPDAKKIILIWHFLGFNKEIRSTRTDEELEKLREETIDLIEKVKKTNSFEPKVSKLCDYCNFKEICPAWKHLYEAKKENYSEDFGVKLVDRYTKLKDMETRLNIKLEETKQKIEEFAKQKNLKAVFGTNQMATIWSKDAVKVPKKDDPLRKEFVSVLKSLNLYEVYSDIDNWNLEKDFDKLTQIQKQVLKNFVTTKKISRIYLRKK
ncbi:MAG: RecB family exonuclease [Candidatus Woesearchaeota archaeon]